MQDNSANTAWGPVFQVGIEQLFPAQHRLVKDSTAIPLLPAKWRVCIHLLRISFIRKAILQLLDKKIPGVRGGLLCRKRYIEETIRTHIHDGFDSIVLLGSGFDTLAYRIPEIASMPVFELDFPQNVFEKKRALQRLKGHQFDKVSFVPIDFNEQEIESSLLTAGYSFDQRSFIVLEGVTQYITERAFRKILSFLLKARSGSMLILTYIMKDFVDGNNLYNLELLYKKVRVDSQTWKLGFHRAQMHSLLRDYKWTEIEDIGNTEYQSRFIAPMKRDIQAMEIERSVLAIKQ